MVFSRLTKHLKKWTSRDRDEAEEQIPPTPDPGPPSPPQPSEEAVQTEKKKKRKRSGRKKKPTSAAAVEKSGTKEDPALSMENWTPPPADSVPAVEGKTRFSELDLPLPLYRGICELGFQYCTPIQQQSLPHTLARKDIAGRAQTGTGKTAAFLITAISRFMRDPKPNRKDGSVRMLVLAPTRELAIQIHHDAEALGKYCGLRSRVVFGGMDRDRQARDLQCPVDILAGTPGRIIDYCRNRFLDLSEAEVLVIDEADRMLDMGFIPDVRRIIAQLPPTRKRQSLLFSATLDEKILRLAQNWLNEPVRVDIEPDCLVTDQVEQVFYSVSRQDKLALLLWILQHESVGRMLVFANRKDTSRRLAEKLRRYGIKCALMSGDIEQRKRLRLLEEFRQGKIPVVIATEVAARGLHVDDISHVVNYDMPYEPEMYVHRIGRTGRAGATGHSISFVCEYGGYMVMDLEEYLSKEIQTTTPSEDMLQLPPCPAGAELDSNADHHRRSFPSRRRSPRSGSSRRSGSGHSSGPRRRR